MRFIGFTLVFVVVVVAYLLSVAPTASFWDCSELIAASYVAGVPHPPGTPLYIMLGRLFTLIPIGREIAFRVNLIPVLFGAVSCGLIYLLVVKLISLYTMSDRERFRLLPHVAGVFAGLMCAFAYSYWDNSVEAEVYGPCVVIALSVLYMALLWRDRVEAAKGDNRLILAAVFLLFLSTGIHFTPMMTVFAVLVFALVVDRESILQLRIFEFVAGYLVILTGTEMGLNFGMVFTVLCMLGATWLGIRTMERSDRSWKMLLGLGLLSVTFVIGYIAAGHKIMDDTVLFLASPTVAIIERWVQQPMAVVILVLGYGAYLYRLHRRGKLDMRYVGLMLGLVFLAGTVQFIMLARAKLGPSINEVNPSHWRDFVSVLKREQYDPMKLLPRKTQFLTEDDWRMNQNARFSVPVAYFEQIKFYLRYFFWQWGNERFFDIFLGIKWQALLGLIPPFLGLWGMWHQFKKEKRSFVLIFVAFLVASLGLITYLNLKYSPSDPRRGDPAQGKLGFLEVRDRDYFYAFSFVFYTIFIGVGAYAFLRQVRDFFRSKRLPVYAAAGVLALFGFVPMALNHGNVTRRWNWIPAEYGYNMLVSCPGEHAVIFTNGDNDTFPLWFMQTVPCRVANYDPNFGKNVAVGILSLLNTNWYCKQLKHWGAPISFTDEQIDRLPRAFAGKNNRTFLLEDIMIRDMVATSAGIRLQWPDDYASTSEEYMAKVFGPGYHPRTPVYFATTVGREKLADVAPYLRLEGLVYRVVPERGTSQVDIERSQDLVYNKYKMASMFDPRVHKDENTKGLFITYAASYLGLATELRQAGRRQEAEDLVARALRFDLDKDRRATLFYHLAVMSMENRNFDRALAALDTIKLYGLTNPEFDIQRGRAYEGEGDFRKAEEAYLAAAAAAPGQATPVQSLTRLYLERLYDTGKARSLLDQWLRRAPGDSASARLLRLIS
jgi:tetratricopeptide (TPR) repeat protein